MRRTVWIGLAVLASLLRRLIHMMARDLPLAPLAPTESGALRPPISAPRRVRAGRATLRALTLPPRLYARAPCGFTRTLDQLNRRLASAPDMS